jgi:hypothetical protein
VFAAQAEMVRLAPYILRRRECPIDIESETGYQRHHTGSSSDGIIVCKVKVRFLNKITLLLLSLCNSFNVSRSDVYSMNSNFLR